MMASLEADPAGLAVAGGVTVALAEDQHLQTHRRAQTEPGVIQRWSAAVNLGPRGAWAVQLTTSPGR